jgi:hypothetical protein
LVTGAAGIAAAGALRFAEEGASVFVVSLDEDECRALAAGLEKEGAVVGWAVSDLTDEEQTRAAFTACLDRFGRIDGLFAVVGASGRSWGDGPLDQIPLDGWRKTIDVNTVPPFLATREAVRSMKETGGGSIVLIGSVLATHPSSLFVTHAYAAAKGADGGPGRRRPGIGCVRVGEATAGGGLARSGRRGRGCRLLPLRRRVADHRTGPGGRRGLGCDRRHSLRGSDVYGSFVRGRAGSKTWSGPSRQTGSPTTRLGS